MRVLVVNAGSTTLKLSVVDDGDHVVATCSLPAPAGHVDPGQLRLAFEGSGLGDVEAVGHRVAHGGTQMRGPIRIDEWVTTELWRLADLAPGQLRQSLAAYSAVDVALPALPAVACFDTAFHATLPAAASTYALPQAWRDRWGLQRFGFHGLSHAWIARRFAAGRVVSCHLGAASSLCAIRDGRSVDTTMGFTPLDGLVMATRVGSVDPGLLFWLLEHTDLRPRELATALESESGLRGLTGTADMRAVIAGAQAGDARCVLGLEVYLHRLVAGISAMVPALGALDTLVFTGGVGQHAAVIRALAAERLGFLGVAIDPLRNAAAQGDADISAADATARSFVLASREDAEIARQVRALLGN